MGGTPRGHRFGAAYYSDLLGAAPDFHIEVTRRHATDEAVVLEVRLSGTHQPINVFCALVGIRRSR